MATKAPAATTSSTPKGAAAGIASRELRIPPERRAAFHELEETLRRLARDNLLGLCAFGGGLTDDPLYADNSAQSVAVLERVDLAVLERVSVEGARLGEQGLAAPLIMTPAYIRDSCDVFPLELLEIQQQHVRLVGPDHFAGLRFDAKNVRLACEREFKSELIQLRQGLLASAGRFGMLHDFSLACLERSARIMRGLLFIEGKQPGARLAHTVEHVAQMTGVPLGMHQRLATVQDDMGVEGFRRFYGELEALAAYANALPG